MILNHPIKNHDMPRNLDLTALRSFVAVADAGGVTRAAGFLNLTQSAVSMQVKRLEEALNLTLLDRSGRGVALTGSGEQLVSYGRRLLALNDEAWTRLTCTDQRGELHLGVPHDIVYPVIPGVLQRFAKEFPRMRIQLHSSFTRALKEDFSRGAVDVILTTEDSVEKGGETLAEPKMIWAGAPGGTAWKQRPLRLAFEDACIFRAAAQGALDRAGIDWEMGVNTTQPRALEAVVSADLAVHAVLDGSCPPYMEPVRHSGALPELGSSKVNLYVRDADQTVPLLALAQMVRDGYRVRGGARMAYKPDSVRSVAAAG